MARKTDRARTLAGEVSAAGRRRAARRTLLLDLDGTLSPIAPTPAAATVPARTLEALRRLAGGNWTVAIVSGRPATQVRSMIPLAGIVVFGSHGMEGAWPGSSGFEIPAGTRRRLARLTRAAQPLGRRRGVLIESKPAGLAIHDRRVDAAELSAWHRERERWLDAQDLAGLERIAGKRVVELRPAGAHKGRAVLTLPPRPGAPRPDESLVGIGDDRTDEDLFRALQGRGLAVRVGRPGRVSAASERLPSPFAVQRFLVRLAELDGGAR